MSLAAFFGGTFDPIHNGHLAIARSARDLLGATIRLMPVADPPHRALPGASAAHRARMLDLAVAGEPGLTVDRRELARDGRSYTVDTLHGIRAELGAQAPIALLIGADSLLDLPQWKEWQALFGLAHFIVAERSGSPQAAGLSPELEAFTAGRWATTPDALGATPSGKLLRLRQPLQDESATDIRRRIATGQPWRDLVPAAVAEYIGRHHLYAGRAASPSPL